MDPFSQILSDPPKPSTNPATLDLSIVIVNYKSMDYLRKCLESIFFNEQDISYEVIVVDNFSQDGSVPLIRAEFPKVRLITNEKNFGFSYANNQGMKISKGRYFLLLNSDTVVPANSLQKLVGIMENFPGIGLLGTKLLNEDGSIQQSYGRVIPLLGDFLQRKLFLNLYEVKKFRWVGKIMERLHAAEKEVEWVKGAAMCLRREAIFGADLLDDRYFMYFEEVDLCLRLKHLGWKVHYTPEVEIIHFGGGSVMKNPDQAKLEYRKSQLYFYKKHFGLVGLTWIRFYLILKMSKNFLIWLAKTKWSDDADYLEAEGRHIREVLDLALNYD